MAISSLLVNAPNIPQPDNSWLDGIAKSLGGVVDSAAAGKIINEDLARGGVPTKQSGGWLNSLFGGNAQKGQFPAAPAPIGQGTPQTAPVAPVSRGSLQGDTYQPFINTVRSGGLTNPYGLAAVAATGRAESGWSAANANRTWSDPSESGQPGTAGGIMSWRGPRYQALAATGDLSPEGQAKFFLQENPQLIQQLNNAGSVEEAQQLMNKAWAFAGHDRPGGESARRMALAQNYYANEFSKAPTNGGAAAIEAIAPLEQGDAAPAPYRDPMVSAPNSRVSAPSQAQADPASMRYTMDAPTAPQPGRAPMQVADASGRVISQPQSQPAVPVDGDLIRRMVQNPITRERGLALWQQAVEGRKQGFDFMMAPNGDLLRTDKQGGASVVGNFAKPNEDAIVVGDNLVRRSNGEVVYEGKPKTPASYQEFKLAQQEGFKGSYSDWEKVKSPGVTVNNGGNSSKFAEKSDEEAAKRLNSVVESGNAAPQMVEDLKTLAQLGTQIGTGRQAQVMGAIGPWAQALGIDIKSMGEIEAFQAITARLIPQMRPPGSGPQTDADARNLLNSIPTVGKTPEGNAIIVQTMMKIQENKIAAAEIASRAYLPEDQGGITWHEAEKQIRALGNPYDAFKQYVKGQNNGQNPPAPSASAPSQNSASQQPAVVRSAGDYDRLPSGAEYTDPNGNIRTKR